MTEFVLERNRRLAGRLARGSSEVAILDPRSSHANRASTAAHNKGRDRIDKNSDLLIPEKAWCLIGILTQLRLSKE